MTQSIVHSEPMDDELSSPLKKRKSSGTTSNCWFDILVFGCTLWKNKLREKDQ